MSISISEEYKNVYIQGKKDQEAKIIKRSAHTKMIRAFRDRIESEGWEWVQEKELSNAAGQTYNLMTGEITTA